MSDPNIKPEKITKPIQLLGAWLAGLFSIDSCFLFAAANMTSGSWEARALIIAAIANVPLFLIAVFLLQTKFRPELQEDSYYSTYLSQKTNEPVIFNKKETQLMEINHRVDTMEQRLIYAPAESTSPTVTPIHNLLIGINRHLSDKETIKSKLADLGVLRSTVFGSDETPKLRVVSISEHLPPDTSAEAVKLARELGFDHYNIFDNRAEGTDEDILIGSYGDPQFEILHKS